MKQKKKSLMTTVWDRPDALSKTFRFIWKATLRDTQLKKWCSIERSIQNPVRDAIDITILRPVNTAVKLYTEIYLVNEKTIVT